ncbi:hypothetical protein PINS_up007819 [Pythium insidiosum]|nr:hypothetical protein PINS_up007819 [Pythium insidiosum]
MALLASTRVRLLVLLALMALLKSVAVFQSTSSSESPATDADDDIQPTAAVAVTTASLRRRESRSDAADGNRKDIDVNVDDSVDGDDDVDDDVEEDDDFGETDDSSQTAPATGTGSNSTTTTIHNVSSATTSDYGALLERVVVHVMEKCCPSVSRYVIGAYPSYLERDGWAPGLTFHAYRPSLTRTLPLDCWEIREINESRSHVWLQLNASDAVQLDASRTFCLPPFERSNGSNVSVRYMENQQRTMSFVSQPILRQFTSTSDDVRPVGWRADQPVTIKEIVLPTHYYWRDMMPHRLIDRVWVHVTSRTSRRQCRGGEAVDGNLNEGSETEPVVTLCVAFVSVPQLSPWIDGGSHHQKLTNLSFVSDVKVLARVPIAKQNGSWLDITVQKDVCNDPQSECDGDSEEIPWEIDLDVVLKRDDQHPRMRSTGTALVFCVHKQSLLRSTGDAQNPTAFVHHLKLDLTQTRWRDRLNIVNNPSTNELAKRSPPRHVRVVAGGTSF